MFKPFLWMLLMITSVCLMAISGRELSASFSTAQVIFVRSCIGVAVIGGLSLIYRDSINLRRDMVSTHFLRNLAHFAGQFGWFFAIAALPLAEVIAIEFTAPLFTVVLAALFLGESLTLTRIVAVLLGFGGVLAIVRPGFTDVELATYVMLGTAFCYAVATVTTKQLAMKQSPLTILLMMVMIQLPISFVIVNDPWPQPTTWQIAMFATVGLTALLAHYCFSRAMMIADAMTIVTIDYLRLPTMVLIGWLLYGELLDVWFALGAALIIGANLLSNRHAIRKQINKLGSK